MADVLLFAPAVIARRHYSRFKSRQFFLISRATFAGGGTFWPPTVYYE
jgi:hypothetical protein